MMNEPLARSLTSARRIVVFSGAGISTDSGIPDYRGTGGQYERYRPVYFQEFLANEEKRVEYWTHKAAVWPAMRDAEPGPAHRLVRALFDSDRLHGVITQNIDGLHERSGIPSDRIVNLHGSNLEVECLGCRRRTDARSTLDPLAALPCDAQGHPAVGRDDIPHCSECGGLLKPATVMFGQNLRVEDLERAQAMLVDCDVLLAIGSTLTVQPAASIPVVARNNGAHLAIVTRGETPLDDLADFRIDGAIADFANEMIAVIESEG